MASAPIFWRFSTTFRLTTKWRRPPSSLAQKAITLPLHTQSPRSFSTLLRLALPCSAPVEPWSKNGRFCTIARHVVIDLSCLRLGLRRDLPWTTIVPNDDEGELGLGHLDALTAPVPEHPNFHIQRDRGASDPLHVGVKADRIANLHWLHEHHVGDGDGDAVWASANRVVVMPAAASIEAMIQPPNMLPAGLVWAGIAKCRAASSPRGRTAWSAECWLGGVVAASILKLSCMNERPAS